MKLLSRLWLPLLVFLLFAAARQYGEGPLAGLDRLGIGQAAVAIRVLVDIGLWLSAGFVAARLFNAVVWDSLFPRAFGRTIPKLVKDLTAVGFLAVAVTAIIAWVFGQSVTGIWATSGVVGIVLGVALRNVILDVFMGLAVNIDQPYRIGDWILVHGRTPRPADSVLGKVTEINWRTTRLTTDDGAMVVLPNSRLGVTTVSNLTSPEPRYRSSVDVTVEAGVPAERVLRVLESAVLARAGERGLLDEPAPFVRIDGLSELGVTFRVRYWTDPDQISFSAARHRVLGSVLRHLRQAGISLAVPQQDVFEAPMAPRNLDTRSTAGRARLLASVPLFGELTEDELTTLAAGLARVELPAGQTLIEQGAAGDSMYLLGEGLLHVFVDGGDGELKVGATEPGSFVGEMSLLTGAPRAATLRAASTSLLWEVTHDALDQLLERRPELAEVMSRAVAGYQLATDAARDRQDQEQETASRAAQILEKMRSWFRNRKG